jgi:DNA-binding transcriptional ArsR family regulator
MPYRQRNLDRVFAALADPTRRTVVELLGGGPAPMTALARPFRMRLPSFAQHLAVLEGCGLVRSRKRGRVRTYRLAPRPLGAVDDWLGRQRLHWSRRLDRLDATLKDLTESQP